MDNKELLSALRGKGALGDAQVVEEVWHKYVIFSLASRHYALPAATVKEICFGNAVYFVPFVPPWVRGYANRHGQPYTVIDLNLVFHNEKLESSTLLILNLQGDQACLLISDVEEIVKVPSGKVRSISAENESSRYFLESIEIDGQEVFVVNAATLLERLERDLEQ